MNLVLDASAAAEIVQRRPRCDELFVLVAEADVVRAPELFVYEVTNLFWKYTAFAGVAPERSARAIERALRLVDTFVPGLELSEESFRLACERGHPAYDMFYLVLARRHGSVLATMDEKMLSLAREIGVEAS